MLKSRLSDLYLSLYFICGIATEWSKNMGIHVAVRQRRNFSIEK
jgi:hypothetical protein